MGELPGVLAVWNDIDPEIEVDYSEWYIQEHLLDRLNVPGILTARRYEVVGPGPKYFTWYQTKSVAILKSPAYLQCLTHPTEWTKRCMLSFRNMNRSACRETFDVGRGIGGATTSMELKAGAGREDDLRQRLSTSLFPDLLLAPGKNGIIRAHLWEADLEVTIQKNPEEALRGEKDRVVDWVVVLEALSTIFAERAAGQLAAYPFAAWGAESLSLPYVYRLLHYLPGPDGR